MTYANLTAPAAGAALPVDTVGGSSFPRTKMTIGAEGSAVDVSTANRMPSALAANDAGLVAVIAAIAGQTYFPTTQPISGAVTVSGNVAVTGTFFQATQPISADALPLPTGASTSAKQDLIEAAVQAVTAAVQVSGTRAYGDGETPLAFTAASDRSGAITATEVLLHSTEKCFVKAGGGAVVATASDVPIVPNVPFHMKITSGQQIAAISDGADGTLNIIPVA